MVGVLCCGVVDLCLCLVVLIVEMSFDVRAGLREHRRVANTAARGIPINLARDYRDQGGCTGAAYLQKHKTLKQGVWE